jgi:hypothetical protein
MEVFNELCAQNLIALWWLICYQMRAKWDVGLVACYIEAIEKKILISLACLQDKIVQFILIVFSIFLKK